jgi:dTDP-4-dehydrorhamnose reductase
MRILVTGASGFLGHWVARLLLAEGHDVVATHGRHPKRLAGLATAESQPLDLEQRQSVRAAFEAARPEAVVHCAAMPDLGPCQAHPELARRCNVEATAELAELTAQRRGRFVFISTDQIFDGEASFYGETDAPKPLHVYGETKLAAERAVLASAPEAVVLRTALIYGDSPSGKRSASEQVKAKLRAGETLRLFTDEFRTPVYIEDAAAAVARCAVHGPGSVALGENGGEGEAATPQLVHLAGPQRLSRYEFGVLVAEAAGLDASAIAAAKQADVDLPLPRPRDLSMRIDLARASLGFAPSDVPGGLARCGTTFKNF